MLYPIRPPKVVCGPAAQPVSPRHVIEEMRRLEGDLKRVQYWGFWGALSGGALGILISADAVSRKTERTVHNILLGASVGALLLGYLSV